MSKKHEDKLNNVKTQLICIAGDEEATGGVRNHCEARWRSG